MEVLVVLDEIDLSETCLMPNKTIESVSFDTF